MLDLHLSVVLLHNWQVGGSSTMYKHILYLVGSLPWAAGVRIPIGELDLAAATVQLVLDAWMQLVSVANNILHLHVIHTKHSGISHHSRVHEETSLSSMPVDA